jgi:hypothetical protein
MILLVKGRALALSGLNNWHQPRIQLKVWFTNAGRFTDNQNESETNMITLSGECAPGPGFWVLSPGMQLRPAMEYAGSFILTVFGSETRYVPGPGVCGIW